MIEGDDDLEVLGFFNAGGGLAGGLAGGAQQGLVADLGDVALEDLAGEGVDGNVGGLAEPDVDDVGFVDLDLGGDDGHVGDGHEGGALGVLDAFDDGFAFANGLIGDDAVEGGDGDGAAEHVLVGTVGGLLGAEVAAGGGGLGFGLGERGLSLGEAGDVEVVGGFFGVEFLLAT